MEKVVFDNKNNKISININSHLRFISKLGLGVGFFRFGDRFLNSEYANELRKGILYRDGNELLKVKILQTLNEDITKKIFPSKF